MPLPIKVFWDTPGKGSFQTAVRHSPAGRFPDRKAAAKRTAELKAPPPCFAQKTFLNIQIVYSQGVALDEFAARLHAVSHKLHKRI